MSVSGILAAIALYVIFVTKNMFSSYSYTLMTFTAVLALIAAEDIETLKIDRIMVCILFAAGTVTAFCTGGGVWRIMLFSLFLTFILYIFSVKSNESVGKGDALCMGAVSLCFTFNNVFACMIYSLLTCLIFGLIQMVVKRTDKKCRLPFTPFLIIGMIMTICFI